MNTHCWSEVSLLDIQMNALLKIQSCGIVDSMHHVPLLSSIEKKNEVVFMAFMNFIHEFPGPWPCTGGSKIFVNEDNAIIVEYGRAICQRYRDAHRNLECTLSWV